MKHKTTWILLADGSRARLLVNAGPKKGYESVLGADLVGENLANSEINSDRPGRSFDRVGMGRHAMEPPSDPHREEKRKLAHRVADLLEAERQKGSFDHLIIIAAPQMLGDLRQSLPDTVKSMIVEEIAKDLSKLSLHELKDTLPKVIEHTH